MDEGSLDIMEIVEWLPQRYPFLLVDRITYLNLDEKKARGLKNVSINEPFFEGHFPENPIMPGVLIVEAMAQVAGILGFQLMKIRPRDGAKYFLVGCDNLRLRKPVVPGDQLVLEACFEKVRGKLWKFHCEAKVGSTTIASGNILCAVSKNESN